MIAGILSNNKLNSIVAELFIRGIKLHISLVFVTQSYCTVPKHIILNSLYYFLWKLQQKRTSTNCIHSFIRYWYLRLYEYL